MRSTLALLLLFGAVIGVYADPDPVDTCTLYKVPTDKPCKIEIKWKVHSDVQATATCLEYFPTTFVTGTIIIENLKNSGKIKCIVRAAYQCVPKPIDMHTDVFVMYDKCYYFPRKSVNEPYVEGTVPEYEKNVDGDPKKGRELCKGGKLSVFYSYTQAKFLGMKAKELGLEKLWIGITKDGNTIEEPKTKIHSELWKVVEGSYWDVVTGKLVLKTYAKVVPDDAKYYFMRTRNDEFNQRYQGSFERATKTVKATFACEFEAKFTADQQWYCDKMGSQGLGLDAVYDEAVESNGFNARCLYVTANKYTWDGSHADMKNIKGCKESPSSLHSSNGWADLINALITLVQSIASVLATVATAYFAAKHPARVARYTLLLCLLLSLCDGAGKGDKKKDDSPIPPEMRHLFVCNGCALPFDNNQGRCATSLTCGCFICEACLFSLKKLKEKSGACPKGERQCPSCLRPVHFLYDSNNDKWRPKHEQIGQGYSQLVALTSSRNDVTIERDVAQTEVGRLRLLLGAQGLVEYNEDGQSHREEEQRYRDDPSERLRARIRRSTESEAATPPPTVDLSFDYATLRVGPSPRSGRTTRAAPLDEDEPLDADFSRVQLPPTAVPLPGFFVVNSDLQSRTASRRASLLYTEEDFEIVPVSSGRQAVRQFAYGEILGHPARHDNRVQMELGHGATFRVLSITFVKSSHAVKFVDTVLAYQRSN